MMQVGKQLQEALSQRVGWSEGDCGKEQRRYPKKFNKICLAKVVFTVIGFQTGVIR